MLTQQIIIDTELKYRNVERVWQLGYQGQGEIIPLIDTGLNAERLPQAAIRSQVDLTEDKDGRDYHGHGTDMARFILGIAPKAQLVGVKALGKKSVTTREDILKALDFCMTLSPRPKCINVSVAIRRSFLGIKVCTLAEPCRLCTRVNELWVQGIAVVAAAGNFSSRPDSYTCPAAARWAIKVRALSHRDESRWRRFVNGIWPSIYQGPDVNRLTGTSQAAAMITGCLAVLGSAFPQKPVANIHAVLNHTGVELEGQDSDVRSSISRLGALGKQTMPNVYRAFVFLRQATERPKHMDHEKSLEITRRAYQLLQGEFDPSEIFAMMETALDLDESNYLAYYYYGVALESLGVHDKALEMLDKCNQLLPPGEALTDLQITGGRGGAKYPP